MLLGNVFAAFGAAPSVALALLSFLYAIASLCVVRIADLSDRGPGSQSSLADSPARIFGIARSSPGQCADLFLFTDD